MRPKYNHLYALGFSVDSDNREGATDEEILRALWVRLLELQPPGEAVEAVGVSYETLDNETGESIDPE